MFSQMRLDKFWLEALIIEATAHTDFKPEQNQAYNMETLDFDLQQNKSTPAYRVRLVIELRADPEGGFSAFRRIRVVVWGQFSFTEDASAEFIEQTLPLNQLAILYGIARGIVVAATGSTLPGAYVLPSVNFVEVVQEKARRMKALEAEAGQAKPERPRASKQAATEE